MTDGLIHKEYAWKLQAVLLNMRPLRKSHITVEDHRLKPLVGSVRLSHQAPYLFLRNVQIAAQLRQFSQAIAHFSGDNRQTVLGTIGHQESPVAVKY